jgi:uncharacterized membrane protein
MRMTTKPEMGSDIVAATSALAGFILVYLGAVATSFSTFDAEQQTSVRAAFVRRAWFAFGGIILALLSICLAILGKWTDNARENLLSLFFLFATLFWSGVIALLAALDVK